MDPANDFDCVSKVECGVLYSALLSTETDRRKEGGIFTSTFIFLAFHHVTACWKICKPLSSLAYAQTSTRHCSAKYEHPYCFKVCARDFLRVHCSVYI